MGSICRDSQIKTKYYPDEGLYKLYFALMAARWCPKKKAYDLETLLRLTLPKFLKVQGSTNGNTRVSEKKKLKKKKKNLGHTHFGGIYASRYVCEHIGVWICFKLHSNCSSKVNSSALCGLKSEKLLRRK